MNAMEGGPKQDPHFVGPYRSDQQSDNAHVAWEETVT